MTEAASAASDDTQARVHVPERSVPGAEPELREVEGTAPAQATEEVLVLDFGGQYSQLIARRIRECGVFSELLPHDTPLERIKERGPKGLVLSGGPASVYADGAPALRKELLELGIPVLGICYGMQLMVHDLGGRVEAAPAGAVGRRPLTPPPRGGGPGGECGPRAPAPPGGRRPLARRPAGGAAVLDEPPGHGL